MANKSLIKLLRRARTLLWTAFSIIVIFSAVVVGLGELLMPYSERFQPRLEAWLSDEFGRPVEIDSFSGEWRAFGPQLALRGLKLAAEDGGPGTAVIDEAVIDIKPLNILIPSRALYDFRVVGADLQVAHLADGRFEFSGLGVGGGEGQSGSVLDQLGSISEVILEDSRLRYDDEVHDIHLELRSINGRLQVRGDEVAAEIGFRLADEATGRVSGELEATGRLRIGEDDHPLSASWQLSMQELLMGQLRERLPDIEYIPRQGRLNAELWGDWDRQGQHLIRGAVDVRGARLVLDDLDRTVEHFNVRLRWHFSAIDEWRLDLSDLLLEDGRSEWTVSSVGLGRSLSAGHGLWVSADAVPVAKPAEIARDVLQFLDIDWPRYLPGRGEGVVRDFELTLNRDMKMSSLGGNFRGASVSDWHKWPDIENVDGRLEFGFRWGRLTLSGTDVAVTWPRMFSSPLSLDLPSCRLGFTWTGVKGEYQVGIDQCAAENEFLSAAAEMRFRGNEDKPAVDVMVFADRLDAGSIGDYWPRDLLKDRVVTWLQNGIVAGDLERGRLQIHGDMDDWPFDDGSGRFEAVFEVEGADIAYFEGWPQANGVTGTARFVNSGMDIQGNIVDIGGVVASGVRARVDDFRDPLLRVEYQSRSELPALIGFLRQSPVGSRIGAELSEYSFEGPANTSGVLTVPLRQAAEGVELDASLTLDGNSFEAPELGFALAGISGELAYDETGIEGEALESRYLDKPAHLSIRAGTETPTSGQGRLVAELAGEFEVGDVVPGQLLETWPPLARISGSSEWRARLETGPRDSTEAQSVTLTLTSMLEGVTVPLPAPLDKSADAAWPLTLSVPLAGDRRNLRLSLADRFGMALSLGQGWSSPVSAAITLGGGPVELPAPGLFSIGGEVETVDLDGWVRLIIDQARAGRGLGGLALETGTLGAAEMRFLDRRFEDVALSFSTAEDALAATFAADTIDGTINYSGMGGGSQSLSGEFERLVLDQPLTSGMEMNVDPSGLPALHLYARAFRYSGVELGETRIEAYPTSEGFHFEKVEAESPNMSVRASGDWALQDGVHRSSFDIDMASESLGDFLRHLDIASPLEGGQTLVHFDVWWEGSPGQFRLAALNGEVEFNVNTGVISNANPGGGRLLGLLSVQSLPRRLALDFRDVFDSGFAFDEASGSFTMLNGSARTEDVTLKSSAANISFSGTTDLVARQYDQLITVRPGIGNTLPVIGAIAGGPGGAAAGLALQGLLHDELGEASQVQYTLTGDWDEPEIVPVLKSASDG